MANSHVNHMADASTNHTPLNPIMVDSSTNQMADSSLSHTPLNHHMAYPSTSQMPYASTNQMPYPNQMAATNTYYRPLNYQMAGHSTYCRPANYQLAAPTFHYGGLNHQLAGSRTFYGPLNHQLAGSNSYYGQLNQLTGPNTYYRPLNHQMAGQNTFYGPLNHQYVRAPFDQNSQSRAHVQNQNLSNQLPLSDIATAAALTEPGASPQLNGNATVCVPLKCVGLPNDEMVHKLEGSPAVAAAPTQTTTTATSQSNSTNQRSKAEDQLHSERPYIKKPSNAFMLFMREHRPKVVAECKITNNASVNVILGQRWKSMSWEEKAPYYKQACEEKQLHFQQHPDWSHMNNYGKKRKRVRGKAATRAKAAAANHEEEPPQVDKRSLASAQASVTEAQLRPTHTVVMQAVYENSNFITATKASSARDSSDSDCESTGSLAPIEDILDVVNVKLPSFPAQTQNALTEFQRVCRGDAIGPTSLLRSPRTATHSGIDSSSSDSDSTGSLAPIEDILGMLDVNLKVSQSPPEQSQPAITESQTPCELTDLHTSTAPSPSPCQRPCGSVLMENHEDLSEDQVGTFHGRLYRQNHNWKSMSWEEKAPYYKQACEAKQLHFQQHPDWSHMNNYGKKRKRVRGKAATRAKAAAADHEEESPQVDKRSLASAQAGVTEAQLRPTHFAVCEDSNVTMATKASSGRDSSDSDCESTGSLALIEDILRAPDGKLPIPLTPPAQTQQEMRESQTVCQVPELSPTSLLGPQQMTESCHVLSVDQLQQLLDYFESQQ